MSDETKTSTPKEIPLHEVVLQIMYEANKERPAVLTVSDVYSKIPDQTTISEINVGDVLRWLVVQKQVECASGKYFSLDRYELIEQRTLEAKRTGKKLNLITDDNPLHEVVLSLMYTVSPEEPGKFTLEDVFWMLSDPKIQRPHVGDVLKWLQSQGRLEYLAGKYSLDRIEFSDQKKAHAQPVKAKKNSTPKPAIEEKDEVKPKIVIPPSEDEVKPAPKKVEKKAAPKEEVKQTTPKPAPKKVEEPTKEVVPLEVTQPKIEQTKQKWRMPVLVGTVICVIYSFYLLFALNATISSLTSDSAARQVQTELTEAKSKLKEIADKGTSSDEDISFIDQKIASLQVIEGGNSKSVEENDPINGVKSLMTRLIVALLMTVILGSILLLIPHNKAVSGKN